jgi:hypothetical protein
MNLVINNKKELHCIEKPKRILESDGNDVIYN